MRVDNDEEHRGAIGMRITQEPAAIHVASDMFSGVKRHRRISAKMHREYDSGDDLNHECDTSKNAKVPKEIQVARNGEAPTNGRSSIYFMKPLEGL
jgi:hypothetical protein